MINRKLNQMLKAVLFLVCFVFMLTPITGCAYEGYSGKNPDLYTVAINSLLWNSGYSAGADMVMESDIKILERDEFGRTLFTYYEMYFDGGTRSISSLIVSQFTADGYVYYYEDCNYLIKEQERDSHIKQSFNQTDRDYLKDKNDWGKELNLNKCTKKEITRNKRDIPTDRELLKGAVADKFNIEESSVKIFIYYLTEDFNKNYLVYGSFYNSNRHLYFVAFVNLKGEVIDWLVPNDLFNYQEELREFKQKNGWVMET